MCVITIPSQQSLFDAGTASAVKFACNKPADNAPVSVAGWGMIDATNFATFPQYKNVSVVPYLQCEMQNLQVLTRVGVTCIGPGSAGGDSGAGALYWDAITEEMILFATVSFGSGTLTTNLNGPTGCFATDLRQGWLQATTGQTCTNL